MVPDKFEKFEAEQKAVGSGGLPTRWKWGLAVSVCFNCGLLLWTLSRHGHFKSIAKGSASGLLDKEGADSFEAALAGLESGDEDRVPVGRKTQRKVSTKSHKAKKKIKALISELFSHLDSHEEDGDHEEVAAEERPVDAELASPADSKPAATRGKEAVGAEDKADALEDLLEKIGLGSRKKGKKGQKEKKAEDEEMDALEKLLAQEEGLKDDEAMTGHLEFGKLLKKEQETKAEHDMATVKGEFEEKYKGSTRSLMCSGCKLIAARFGTELNDHDVHDQEAPHLMLAAKRRALDAACKSFRHLDVVDIAGSLRFEAVDSPEGAEGEKKRIGQRLCTAVLEDARFDVLMKMMQSKVPHMSHLGATHKTNWERFLCYQKNRLCKRSEVREDDDDEEEL